ncbi:MAG: glutamate--tRNA ligase [Ignavibacteriae bacterium]|nr:glutamate--tRNA ligase [Ignavibacteriota bacterium]MCB9217704.1 glutamate--tRNA ligase [Ignavibacteria bacterium]
MTRVRFAPSPTGFLHIGALRTALYNFLFTRHMKGTMILRIEDTDRTRFVEGAEEDFIKMCGWVGIEFDEGSGIGGEVGPYRQSERTDIYRQHIEMLVERGTAYYAFDTAEELDAMRGRQQQAGIAPKYDRSSMRNQFTLGEEETKRLLAEGAEHTIRLFVPLTGETRTRDLVRGESVFSNRLIDDQILIKSDGFPTYHLANIVDDHLMNITHVIRGEEWLPSLPKHIILYQAFGWEPPEFAHLPLILNKERKKFSKRDGDTSVKDFVAKGYLPEALVNFIALLGWNPTADREIYSLQEMIDLFELTKVNKSGAIFDVEKLNWMNGMYLRQLPVERLVDDLMPMLEEAGFNDVDRAYAVTVVELVKERINFLHDVPEFADYLFGPVTSFDEEYHAKQWKEETGEQMKALADRLEGLAPVEWKTEMIEGVIRSYAEELGMSAGKLIHPLRLSLTGKRVGAGMFETMEVLGQERTITRLRDYLAKVEG